MMNNNHIDKKLDDILEKLNYLGMVIRNLKDREGTLITEVGEIDERLFREIVNYEMSIEELKRDFVSLMIKDARKLADACVSNINISEKSEKEFNKFDEILDFVKKHEDLDIEKSRELQEFAMETKETLKDIRKDMNEKVTEEKEEKNEF